MKTPQKIQNLIATAKTNKKALGVKALTIGGTALGAFALGAVLTKAGTDDVEIASLQVTEVDSDGSETTTLITTTADTTVE